MIMELVLAVTMVKPPARPALTLDEIKTWVSLRVYVIRAMRREGLLTDKKMLEALDDTWRMGIDALRGRPEDVDQVKNEMASGH